VNEVRVCEIPDAYIYQRPEVWHSNEHPGFLVSPVYHTRTPTVVLDDNLGAVGGAPIIATLLALIFLDGIPPSSSLPSPRMPVPVEDGVFFGVWPLESWDTYISGAAESQLQPSGAGSFPGSLHALVKSNHCILSLTDKHRRGFKLTILSIPRSHDFSDVSSPLKLSPLWAHPPVRRLHPHPDLPLRHFDPGALHWYPPPPHPFRPLPHHPRPGNWHRFRPPICSVTRARLF
jgi:hypothetical protein